MEDNNNDLNLPMEKLPKIMKMKVDHRNNNKIRVCRSVMYGRDEWDILMKYY